ncbi:glycosyltransferase family 2 protein [Actinomadura gamaensis]|uniref:Glycosyltransferase family 2 protein n=1 Tax=Actinomadura gamaensis TaxID=1763541 RepID=A0ABV9U0W4_9ACTN
MADGDRGSARAGDGRNASGLVRATAPLNGGRPGRERADVTVVIATRDRRDQLLRTLGRLCELPERPPIIVVDNASRDGGPDAVRRRFPEVRVVELPANRGACARNVGVRRAGTPYVAFSDDDSWWEAGALDTAARALDAHPRLALLVGRIRLAPDGRPDPVSRKMGTAPLGREDDLPGPSVLGFPACGAVVRRDAFLAVGGFDDLLFFGGEETLLALDLAAGDRGLAYLDTVHAWHDPHGAGHQSPERWALQQRNDVLVTWMRLSPGRTAARTWRLARAAVTDPAARGALTALLRRLPAALARRRRVPRALEKQIAVLHELQ